MKRGSLRNSKAEVTELYIQIISIHKQHLTHFEEAWRKIKRQRNKAAKTRITIKCTISCKKILYRSLKNG